MRAALLTKARIILRMLAVAGPVAHVLLIRSSCSNEGRWSPSAAGEVSVAGFIPYVVLAIGHMALRSIAAHNPASAAIAERSCPIMVEVCVPCDEVNRHSLSIDILLVQPFLRMCSEFVACAPSKSHFSLRSIDWVLVRPVLHLCHWLVIYIPQSPTPLTSPLFL